MLQRDFQLFSLWAFSLYQEFLHLISMYLLSLPIGRLIWYLPKTWLFLCFEAIFTLFPSTRIGGKSKYPVVSQSAYATLIAGCCQKSWQHHLPPVIINHVFSTAPVLVQSRDALDKWGDWKQTIFLILGLAFWHFDEGLWLLSWMHGLQGLQEAVRGIDQGQEKDSRGRRAHSETAQWVPAVEWHFSCHYWQPATLSWS